jgi:hypothetical protein
MGQQNEFPIPPLDFTPISDCEWAEFSATAPEFIRDVKRRGRRRLGQKYEAQVHAWLKDKYGDDYMPSQWLRYKGADGRIRWCQTDGVLRIRDEHALVVVEVKYNHTDLAWWQLFRLYIPVLERVFHGYGYEFRGVEVCKWFDCAVRCPQPPRLRDSLAETKAGDFSVHIWSP